MKNQKVKVRFAPSPTGTMHLGNIRAALMNVLFAKQNDGVMILRIEDTDRERLVDPEAKKILSDLAWLNLPFDDGPYFQSKHTDLYEKNLQLLREQGLVYRCFETPEELEEQRQAQLAQGCAPRYNKAGRSLTPEELQKNLDEEKPFIWRFKIPEGSVTIEDIARGPITFDLAHFSDFPLTRQDGSFTFTFANFVDDMTMGITHVFRGEDHLTNTATQATLYNAFKQPLPLFYHMPLICNSEGKKLSKRDFGFSLRELQENGFIPEAICNYLAIIGGSFSDEIMDFDELIQAVRFDRSSPKSMIHYDIEKLRWVNQKWLSRLSLEELAHRFTPLLISAFPAFAGLPSEQQMDLIALVRDSLVTLNDCVEQLAFYFETPTYNSATLEHHGFNEHLEFLKMLVTKISTHPPTTGHAFFELIKTASKEHKKPLKDVFSLVRIALTGAASGIGIKELFDVLGDSEVQKRLERFIKF